MYKVIFVDDESLIIESLKVSIDWEKEGFRIIGSALNGVDALELIRKFQPDIVFTDIRMPGISGIELIKRVSEINPNILFVIVSGYAEFSYAQKALKYNAVGYCLKPFDEDEILSILSKAKGILKSRNNDNSTLLEFSDIYSQDTYKVKNILNEVGISVDDNRELIVIASIGQRKLSIPENIRHIEIVFDYNKRIYLLQSQYNNRLKHCFLEQLSGDIMGIGVITDVKQYNMIKSSVIEAIIAAYQFFISGKGVYSTIINDTSTLSKYLKDLDDLTRKKDAIGCEECLNNIRSLFESGTMNIRNAFKVYNLIMALLCCNKEADEAIIDNYEQLIDSYENVYNMLDELKRVTINQCIVSSKDNLQEIDNATVYKIIEYINSNFYKPITIQQLSEKFFITPNYISFLFKKFVGENFKNYIIKLRITYACELLENSKYSVQEVGEKVGYNDYFYFIRIFKSIKGISPSKYREEYISK